MNITKVSVIKREDKATGGRFVSLTISASGKVYVHRYYTKTQEVVLSDCPAEVLAAAKEVAYVNGRWQDFFAKPAPRYNASGFGSTHQDEEDARYDIETYNKFAATRK